MKPLQGQAVRCGRTDKPARPFRSKLRERLVEIGEQVVDMLDADRQPHRSSFTPASASSAGDR
ncbi:hypothetical protein WT63_17515 [Burkholderia anthina]|nr:hypothetical protein WT63_17515 [Burkholderia anthina]